MDQRTADQQIPADDRAPLDRQPPADPRPIVAIDIGGTHARFALAEIAGGRVVSLAAETTLRTADHASLPLAYRRFRDIAGPLPPAAAIAFAGPVHGETIQLTNSPWVVRPATLADALGLDALTIVNDFGAVAHAVAQVGDEHLAHVCGPDRPVSTIDGIVSIVGPGTGLGVAHLLRRDGGYVVTETEGGHLDFAPLDMVEDAILAQLRRRYRRVSTERIVSGPGLRNLAEALAATGQGRMPEGDDAALWAAALAAADPLAAAALDRWFLSFGSVAGDIALAQGAAAVVLAGGVGQRVARRIAGSGFPQRFVAKGRFERLMAALPVRLVTHPQPGLYGATAAFAQAHAGAAGPAA